MIRATGVEKRRGELTVVLDRLQLAAGSASALVGASGCGKSTALDLLAGTLRPDRGAELSVAGQTLLGGGDLTRWRAKTIGYVLQTGGLIPSLSVAENILLPRRLLGLSGWGGAAGVAHRLGLDGLLQRAPGKISIGERQRVAIARALAHDPPVVLADEPTAALDPERAADVMTLLVDLTRERGATLLIVTHDAALAARAGLTVIACRSGGGRTQIGGMDP